MRKIVKADQGKLDKIQAALAEAIATDDTIKLQEALEISVKTRDNSFSVSNQLRMASDPGSPYDLFASDGFRLVSHAMREACKVNAHKCLKYFLIIVPHEFRLHQRCLRDAVNASSVEAVKALLEFTGKLDDELILKHMTIVFMDEGSPEPVPALAKSVAESVKNKRE